MAANAADNAEQHLLRFIMTETQSFWWKRIVNIAKTAAVICAFFAFSISMRQKEMDRFSAAKPLFEITTSTTDLSFTLKNHGGLVYFVGIFDDSNGNVVRTTPRQYSTLGVDNDAQFELSGSFKEPWDNKNFGVNKGGVFIYWRDVDLNTYELRVIEKQDGYYIAGIPLTFRSTHFISISRQRLDYVFDCLFPKDWWSQEKPAAFKGKLRGESSKKENIDDLDGSVVAKYHPTT